MSDMQDRIARLATEARQRADMAGTQAAWQEGRAHGLREASAAVAAAADTRTLRDDIRDLIKFLDSMPAMTEPSRLRRQSRLSPQQLAIDEAAVHAERIAWRQIAERLRGLLAADEPEESDDE
jgi:hypothetical protein